MSSEFCTMCEILESYTKCPWMVVINTSSTSTRYYIKNIKNKKRTESGFVVSYGNHNFSKNVAILL